MNKVKSTKQTKHISKGSVLNDLEFTFEQKVSLAIKISLFEAIEKHIAKLEYDRRDLEKILDIPQPRVSELMRGKVGKMRIETLLGYASKLGLEAEVSLRKAA